MSVLCIASSLSSSITFHFPLSVSVFSTYPTPLSIVLPPPFFISNPSSEDTTSLTDMVLNAVDQDTVTDGLLEFLLIWIKIDRSYNKGSTFKKNATVQRSFSDRHYSKIVFSFVLSFFFCSCFSLLFFSLPIFFHFLAFLPVLHFSLSLILQSLP